MSDAWIGAVGGLLGVALGAGLQLVAGRSSRLADRRRRLREELLDAYTQFAAACVEYRRTQIHLRKITLRDEADQAKRDAADADRKIARASAWTAFSRMCLLSAPPAVDACARELLGELKGLKSATAEAVDSLGVEAHWKIQEFTNLAGGLLPAA
jgi:hypothetical protein